METKEELLSKVREIEKRDAEAKAEKVKQNNYEKFLKREPDWVIGLAHCDIGTTKIDYDWHTSRYFSIGKAISIHGNCGTNYNAEARITSATHTYFHNVWTEPQRARFQKALDKVALKEITKIMNSLRNKLEILGLQSDDFYLNNLYPKDKVESIKEETWKETVKLLNTYKDKDFIELFRTSIWSDEEDENGKRKEEVDLSHSRMILYRYIFQHRPRLQKRFNQTQFYTSWKDRIHAKYD